MAPDRPTTAEHRFRVMGAAGHVVVVDGPPGALDRAVARLEQLEARWSRFIPTSELSTVNRANGAPVVVSADTVLLVRALGSAWAQTGGRFDPTVHDTLCALGYDRPFADLADRADPIPGVPARPTPARPTNSSSERAISGPNRRQGRNPRPEPPHPHPTDTTNLSSERAISGPDRRQGRADAPKPAGAEPTAPAQPTNSSSERAISGANRRQGRESGPGVPLEPTWWATDLDDQHGYIQLPAGIHLDPGGLGKGLAADLVATELLAIGARGALVSLGGDVRVAGRSPHGGEWQIAVEDPDDPERVLAVVPLTDGGLATTTPARRHWTAPDGTAAHHLIDPDTHAPADTRWRQVTVVAGTAAWAEVAAKVAFLDGRLPDDRTSALLVATNDQGDAAHSSGVVGTGGRITALGNPRWFRRPAANAA